MTTIKPKKKNSASAKKAKPIIEAEPLESKQEIHHHYYPNRPRKFDFGKLSFGLFLLVLGVLYLAKNLGWLSIDFNFNIWELWPLLIIFAGLSLLTGRTLASIFAGIILTLTVLTIAFILIFGQSDYKLNIETQPSQPSRAIEYKSIKNVFPVKVSADEKAQSVDLAIKASFSTANINGGSSDLINGKLETNFTELIVNNQTTDGKQQVSVEARPKSSRLDANISLMGLQLSDKPLASIYLESLASTVNLNLAKINSQLVSINTVASDLSLDLSQSDSHNVELTAKATQIKLFLPENQPIKISLKNKLKINSNKLEKIDDFTYQSPDYSETKADKIDLSISLSGGDLIIK